MDASSLYDVSRASIPAVHPTPLAMPLHSGFDVPRKQAILPNHPAMSKPSPLPQTTHRRSISVPPVADAPSRRLTVRNGDVPSPQTPNDPFSDVYKLAPPTSDPSPSTPVTRLLTTTHARRSSSVDPFVTPFDDEHRVTIAHADHAGARKSVQTNPFAAIAV
jgi:hypothetical protein